MEQRQPPHQTRSTLQIPELHNQHSGLLCVGVACYAAVDKLERVPTLVLLSRPKESTTSCTHAPDCPQIASDLTCVGSCDSTLHVEIPADVSLHRHYVKKPDNLQNHDFSGALLRAELTRQPLGLSPDLRRALRGAVKPFITGKVSPLQSRGAVEAPIK